VAVAKEALKNLKVHAIVWGEMLNQSPSYSIRKPGEVTFIGNPTNKPRHCEVYTR
jgi:hypothetical protein